MSQNETYVIGLCLQDPTFDLTEEQLKEEYEIDIEKSPNLLPIIREIRKMQKTLIENRIAYEELESPIGKQNQKLQLSQIEESEKSLKGTMDAVGKIKTDFSDSIAFSQRAFKYVMIMYIVAFYLGIALIVTAVVFAAMDKTILAIAFGAFGLVDIITYFLKDPPNKIQESRANLVQMTISALSWLKEFINNDAILASIPNMRKNENGLVVGLSAKETVNVYKDLASDHITNTEKLLALIDKYAEPKK